MVSLVPILIVGWLGVAYVLFRTLPGPVAVLTIMIVGQLFLPEIGDYLPDYLLALNAPEPLALPVLRFTKTNTIGYALLFGSLLADWRRWKTVSLKWYDLPMAALCICALFPAVSNGIGPYGGFYEGGRQSLDATLAWGVPYWCGRLYLGSRDGLRLTAAAIVLGGMIYLPLCLIELRLSPQLHRWVYGYYQHVFIQTMRDGGFRPMVFMEHGLMVGLWMATAALTAFWLWHEGTYRCVGLHPRLPAIGLKWVVLALAGVTALLHSVGAVILGLTGAAALLIAKHLQRAAPILVLVFLPSVYVTVRYTEIWNGQDLVVLAREYIGSDRANSLDYRLENEYRLLNRAKQQPLFGWGDAGAALVVENPKNEKVIADSGWIIRVGNHGLFGLVAFLAALMTPVLRFTSRLTFRDPREAPAAVLCVALTLYLLDHMVNSMVNPIFSLVAGALAGAAQYYRADRVVS